MALTKITGQVVNTSTDLTVGVLTATTVSVGGTLTYEDVTNVDSVGLITARNGIEVTDKGVQVGTGATVDSAAANTLTFLTGGSERLRITSGGDVGINQNSPAVKLHASKSYSAPTGGFDSNIVAALTNSGTDSYAGLAIQGGSGAGTFIHFGDTDDSNIGVINYEHSDNSFRFTTNTSESMRIDSSGRLLLGTTTEGRASATDNLTIADSADCGITIRSGTSNDGAIDFSDSTSGNGEFAGQILYDHGSNFMRFMTASAERMRIDSSGNFGIGTNSPSSNLHIASSLATIRLEDSDVAGGASYSLITSSSNGNIEFLADPNNVRSSTDIRFSVDGSERIRIDSSGNFGIGTASPGAGLHIDNPDNSAITQILDTDNQAVKLVFRNNTETGNNIQIGADGSSLVALTNASERLRIDSSGRVLVGTTTSETINGDNVNLQIKSTGASAGLSIHRSQDTTSPPYINLAHSRAGAIVSNNDNLGAINFFGHDGTDLNSLGGAINCQVDGTPGSNDMPGRLVFSTTGDGSSSPTERMRITKAGEVKLLGTGGTEDNCIDIIYNSASGVGQFNVDSNGGSTEFKLGVSNSATLFHPFTIDSTGQTGVYRQNSSTGNSVLYVQSNVGSTARVQWYVLGDGDNENRNGSYGTISSDERMKRDIVDAPSQWDDIKNIRMRKFRYKADGDAGQVHIGVIAQELETVCPNLIKRKIATEAQSIESGGLISEGEELLTWKQSIVHLKAIKALQEAMTRIETLETQNADLLSRVTALEG